MITPDAQTATATPTNAAEPRNTLTPGQLRRLVAHGLRTQGMPAWRVSTAHPCPVCGKPDWCLAEPTDPSRIYAPRLAVCMREESRVSFGQAGFIHQLASITLEADPAVAAALDATNLAKASAQPSRTLDQRLRVHEAYAAILDALTPSDDARRRIHFFLTQSGLTASAAELLDARLVPGVNSTPVRMAAATLLATLGPETFRNVPGCRIVEAMPHPDEPIATVPQHLELAFHAGETIVFPSRAADGLIEGLRLRSTAPRGSGPTYTWFSWKNEPAKPRNRQNRPPAAVYRPAPGNPAAQAFHGAPCIIVTEGEKKAAAAADAFGCPAISIPGVSTYASAIDALNDLDPTGEAHVLLAFDLDVRDNKAVRRALASLAKALAKDERIAEALDWPATAGKGIDDALHSSGRSAIRRVPLAAILGPASTPAKAATPATQQQPPTAPVLLPIAPGLEREPTDMGNAARLIRDHGKNLRHVWAWQQWLVWTGARWEISNLRAREAAKLSARQIIIEAAKEPDPNQQLVIAKWARTSQNKNRLEAALWTAATDPRVSINIEQLDADPFCLNVLNGSVNLLTGELTPHRREDFCTRMAPVAHDPNATCPAWHKFLDRIFRGDADLIQFIQRAVGYSLTGSTEEQCVFIAWGEGANGKSTLLNTIAHVLGDYATEAAPETFTEQRRTAGQASPEIARLRGARFVTTIETGEGQRLHESLVKSATGGEKLTTRQLYGEFFEFKPNFKIWLATNHKPAIRGTDEGIWRRLRLIPFEVTIPEQERDRSLPSRLLDEAPGILNWAIQGALEWQRDRLYVPESVREATQAYRMEQDVFGRFLADRCIITPRAQTSAQKLWKAWEEWCAQEGEEVRTQTWLGRQLARNRELSRVKLSNGNIAWRGIVIENSTEHLQADLNSTDSSRRVGIVPTVPPIVFKTVCSHRELTIQPSELSKPSVVFQPSLKNNQGNEEEEVIESYFMAAAIDACLNGDFIPATPPTKEQTEAVIAALRQDRLSETGIERHINDPEWWARLRQHLHEIHQPVILPAEEDTTNLKHKRAAALLSNAPWPPPTGDDPPWLPHLQEWAKRVRLVRTPGADPSQFTAFMHWLIAQEPAYGQRGTPEQQTLSYSWFAQIVENAPVQPFAKLTPRTPVPPPPRPVLSPGPTFSSPSHSPAPTSPRHSGTRAQ